MKSRRFPFTLDECMDVLDWFDAPEYEYLNHIWLSKLDGEARLARALPEIRKHARRLLDINRGTESAYPMELLNQPA